MTSELLGWPPILWTARILILILLLSGIACASLYFYRFFRWKHIKAMARAELPRLKEVGGSGKFLGQELAINAKLDDVRETDEEALGRRVAALEQHEAQIDGAIREIVAHLLRREGQYDVFDRNPSAGESPGGLGEEQD